MAKKGLYKDLGKLGHKTEDFFVNLPGDINREVKHEVKGMRDRKRK